MFTDRIDRRRWEKWKGPILLAAVVLVLSAIRPYLNTVILALPTALQLLLGMLILMAVPVFAYMQRSDDDFHSFDVLIFASLAMLLLAMMRIVPDVTSTLTVAFAVAAMIVLFGRTAWKSLSNRRTV